jgi:pyruvate/2-oxoglutarate/acetoin dehydrogenase E1 component
MWVLQMTVREALSTAIDEEMSADSKVLVLGEEVLGVCHLQLSALRQFCKQTPLSNAGTLLSKS